MPKFQLKLGDIFTIPINDKEVGFGQIVVFPRTKDVFIMRVFNGKNDKKEKVDIETICNSSTLFLGYSTDAKLYHKDWNIIGNSTVGLDKIVLPYHKLGTPPKDIYITNYKGERLQEIDELTFQNLSYETNFAPVRYENALKAYYKLQEWKTNEYDKLLYENALKSNEIYNSIK